MNRKLTVALSLSLLLLLASVAVALGGNGNAGLAELGPTPLAANAGLEGATGTGVLAIYGGYVRVEVDLGGATLPEGSVLEGWVVDAGLLGGPGTTSVSDADEVYGPPFGNPDFDAMVENAPYALSTGVLKKQGRSGKYVAGFRIANNLTPYDAVVITLESDGNGENYDPRPGTPVLAGEIVR